MRLNADLLRFDPAVLFDEAGNARPLKDIPVEARRWIKRVRVHKQNLTAGDGQIDKVLDYEIYDKSAALERDYKRWGLSKERLEHDGEQKIVIQWLDQDSGTTNSSPSTPTTTDASLQVGGCSGFLDSVVSTIVGFLVFGLASIEGAAKTLPEVRSVLRRE